MLEEYIDLDSYLTLDAFAEIASASEENVCTDFYLTDIFFDCQYASAEKIYA